VFLIAIQTGISIKAFKFEVCQGFQMFLGVSMDAPVMNNYFGTLEKSLKINNYFLCSIILVVIVV
jgi:hypothetical protein